MSSRAARSRAFLSLLLVVAVSVTAAACVVPPAPARSDRTALARGPRVADETVEYAPGLFADVFRPRSGGNRGVVVLVHAGAFYTGSRAEIALYAHPVMDQIDRGFTIMSVDYRLTTATANRFPAALQDVSRAIDWVRSDGSAHGMNPRRIIIAGHSAGGTIAALIGLGANNPGSGRGTTPRVDGWLSISGFYDLRSDGTAALQRQVWLGPNAGDETASSASAVTLVDADDPPGYLIAGSNDPLVPKSQPLVLALATLKVDNPALLDLVSDPNCDGHIPMCAVNMTFLNHWIDGL